MPFFPCRLTFPAFYHQAARKRELIPAQFAATNILNPLKRSIGTDIKNFPQRNLRGRPPGAISLSAPFCVVCLGKHDHNYKNCDSRVLAHTTIPAFSRRVGPSHKLQTRDGRDICVTFQLQGCQKEHNLVHLCSACGSPSHGSATCILQKEVRSFAPL